MINCVFENGRKTSLRHAVVDVLLIKENQILLVKRAPHLLNGGKYALVGGFVERDEFLEDAVRREVKEETGYGIKEIKLFRIIDDPNRPQEDRQNISFVYLAAPSKKKGEPDLESTEVSWFSLINLPKPKEFAFDHYKNIELYLKYSKKKLPLPLTP